MRRLPTWGDSFPTPRNGVVTHREVPAELGSFPVSSALTAQPEREAEHSPFQPISLTAEEIKLSLAASIDNQIQDRLHEQMDLARGPK